MARTAKTNPGFELESRVVGALPLVNHVLERLRFEHIFERHLPAPDPRATLPPLQALGVLVRNLVLARVPLYAMEEWARERVPSLLGLAPEQVDLLNDDRVGRALDRLFDTDRQALLTAILVHMVKEFKISLEELHNDSTTITLHGQYKGANGKRVRGKPTLVVTLGHNKDHRPDLKQLVWILTVSADGAVPVYFKVVDGNTEDSTTHIETWERLRLLVGSTRFLYVADSKLCTRENMKHINSNGGKFITVMPRSRKEDKLFKDWLQANAPAWQEVARKPHPRLKHGLPDVFRALSSPIPDPDGFRVIWYQSSHKIERDAAARSTALQSAWKALVQLKARVEGPRPRFRSCASVAAAADDILKETRTERWIQCEASSAEGAVFRKETRGRPGTNSRWRRQLKMSFRLDWALRKEEIDYDARTDGVFPLITDYSEAELSDARVLEAYKSNQPLVEKRHDLLKNVEAATPMYLKSVSRIEALLFMHFVALLAHALIEREVRRAMRSRRLRELPLYPEDRPCKAPSTRRVLEVFENLQRHVLYRNGREIQRFEPEVSGRQVELLQLFGMTSDAFLTP